MSDDLSYTLDQIQIENMKLKQQLEDAVEVIEFYGNHTNWETEILSKRACYKKVFKDCDIERVKVMVGYVDSCGKRARQFLAKYKENRYE